MADGGRIVVLAQDRLLPGLPVKTALESREWVSMPMVRTPQHPLLASVTSWDLHFWSPDHLSAQGAYAKPEGGPFVALVDSGTDTGLEWVEMMECYSGRGLYLLNQLPVAAKYHVEPMAREILRRLIAYAAGGIVGARQQAAGLGRPVVAGGREAHRRGRRLAPVGQDRPCRSGLSCSSMRPKCRPISSRPPLGGPPWPTGATLVVHGARPEHGQWLSSLAGKPVTLAA